MLASTTSTSSRTRSAVLRTAHPFCASPRFQVVLSSCTTTSSHQKLEVGRTTGKSWFSKDSIKMAEVEMKRKLFIWEKQHELCLLKEVTCVEPYAKKQSDRGAAWRTIASNLNGNKQEGFKVTERSCRDRFKKLMEEFENKEQVEKKASGIDAEYDELDQLCQDIKERMEEVSSQEEAESAKKKAESEKAASMRQMAMETVAETKKRKSTGGDEESQPPRRRGADTMQFLQESLQIRSQQLKAEQALRERELQLREAELRQTQQQQQQQQQLMLQMLQQLTDVIKTNKSS